MLGADGCAARLRFLRAAAEVVVRLPPSTQTMTLSSAGHAAGPCEGRLLQTSDAPCSMPAACCTWCPHTPQSPPAESTPPVPAPAGPMPKTKQCGITCKNITLCPIVCDCSVIQVTFDVYPLSVRRSQSQIRIPSQSFCLTSLVTLLCKVKRVPDRRESPTPSACAGHGEHHN